MNGWMDTGAHNDPIPPEKKQREIDIESSSEKHEFARFRRFRARTDLHADGEMSLARPYFLLVEPGVRAQLVRCP